MNINFADAIRRVATWCESHGIRVKEGSLPPEKAGEFTGKLVVMNRDFRADERPLLPGSRDRQHYYLEPRYQRRAADI